MGYPKQILSTRAVVKHGCYAVIPPDGLVNNVIPGFEECKISILASPKMGAGFAMYLAEVQPGGATTAAFCKDEGIESFLYVISGKGRVGAGADMFEAHAGSYIYSAPGKGISFVNNSDSIMKLLLYKQCFLPVEGIEPPQVVFGSVNDIEYREYDEMANVFIKDLLPVDIRFDMNFHILSFEPGGCHPFVETHVQEHGAYILKGEGCYLIDNEWRMITSGDFVWFGAYVTQAAYGVGRQSFTYIYSKDCNRDVQLP